MTDPKSSQKAAAVAIGIAMLVTPLAVQAFWAGAYWLALLSMLVVTSTAFVAMQRARRDGE